MTTNGLSVPLASIESALQRLDSDRPAAFPKGWLARLDVACGSRRGCLPVPPELESLYGWRNGTSTVGIESVGDIHLFPGYYLLSLEDAIANYQTFLTDSRWTAGWLPIFANGGGDFYVLDLDSSALPVRHFRIEESEHPIEFNSLGSLLTTLASAFEPVFFSSTGVDTWIWTTSPSESSLPS